MTADKWLQLRGASEAECRSKLPTALDPSTTALEVEVRSPHVLKCGWQGLAVPTVQGSGRQPSLSQRRMGRQVRDLAVHAFHGSTLPVPLLTHQLLCNVVRLAVGLRVNRVFATPRGRNAAAHLRAGFIPSPQAWRELRNRLRNQLSRFQPVPDEQTAPTVIAAILGEEEPSAIRRLLLDTGGRGSPGTRYPNTCSILLGDPTASWYGSLNLDDAPSCDLFRQFAACHEVGR